MIVSRNAKMHEVEVVKNKTVTIYPIKADCEEDAKVEIMRKYKLKKNQVKSVQEIR